MKSILSLRKISKSYISVNSSCATNVLKDIDLDVFENELVTIVGSSGSGKSTLLNIIAQVVKPDFGEIDLNPSTKLGYVFQANAVFPWMTFEENLSYPLRLKKMDKKDIYDKIEKVCDLIELPLKKFKSKFPKELSGGENRRLALGMVIVFGAELLLLDEPTSQLDYFTACAIQDVILKLKNELGLTVIMVTHSLEEAAFLSDRVLVLKKGMITDNRKVEYLTHRTNNLRESPELLKIRNEIRSLFSNQEES